MTWANQTLLGAAAVLAGVLSVPAGARAQEGPVIAIPGHPDVPVIINGRDASFAVVVGDWGLARPGAAPVTVYGPWAASLPGDERGYYPSTGRRPRSGRQEIETPARLLPPSPSYRRSWSSGSRSEPADANPPSEPPQVTVSPGGGESSDGLQTNPKRKNALPNRRAEVPARPDQRKGRTP